MTGTSSRPGRSVGRRVVAPDWEARTTGSTDYTADLRLPGQLEAVIVRSPHAHAELVSIDPAPALALPGVHAVLTAADFAPGTRYLHRGGPLADRPPLPADRVRFVGQEVAVVAADDLVTAREAAARVQVRYRPLPAALTIDEARAPGAPQLHDRRATSDEPNVSVRWAGAWGEGADAFEGTVHEVAGTFVHPSVSQAAMEPGVTLAHWHEATGELELWTSTQAPYFVAKDVAHVLGLDLDAVVTREIAVGGGFGAKSKIREHEVLAARLSMLTGRPVMLRLSRAEEFATTKPRHEFRTRLRVGADADGRLRAIDATVEVDNGAFNHYGSSVMKVGVMTLGSLYQPAGVRFDARLVDTATQPGGQYRGYGVPQVSFAMESLVDELALRCGRDPVAFRLDNDAPAGPTLAGARVGATALSRCLEVVRDELDWDHKRRERRPWRGVGVAVGTHGSGAYAYERANEAEATVDVAIDGRVRVRFGGADAGTGQRVVIAQVAAEVLDVDPSQVEVRMMDGRDTPFDMGSWSSRGTHMAATAVRRAAELTADALREHARELLGTGPLEVRDGALHRGDGASLPFGEVVRRAGLDELSITGAIKVPDVEPLTPDGLTANLSPTYAFAAHGVEVEVDPGTGQVTVLDYVAAHDVGTPINPTQVEGQIRGGVLQGLGAALGEKLVRTDGRVANPTFLHYAVPRSGDGLRVRPFIVAGGEDPAGPYGAKSVGEMAIGPVAAAVANAVRDAIGVRLHELPLTPDRVRTAIEGRARHHRLATRPGRWWVAGIRALYPRGLHRTLEATGRRFGWPGRPRPLTSVHHATSVTDAAGRLDDTTRVVGGGTDLVPAGRDGVLPTTSVVSLARLEDATRTTGSPGGRLRIGAAVTLTELLEDDRTPAVLRETIATIASPQVRNAATVAGNLLQEKRCWFFRNGFDCYKRAGVLNPCYAVLGDHRFQHAVIDGHRCQAVTPSDLATVLVALDAEVELGRADGEVRRVPVAELYTGPAETCLRDDEVVAAVVLPPVAHRRGVFEKLQLTAGDFAIASVALVAGGAVGGVGPSRIVLGALAPTPWEATRTAAALDRGADPGEVVATFAAELDRAAHPLPGNAWKLDAVEGLLSRALERLPTLAADGAGVRTSPAAPDRTETTS